MFHSRAKQCLNHCPKPGPLEQKMHARHTVQKTDHQLDIWTMKSPDLQPVQLYHSLQTNGALHVLKAILEWRLVADGY